MLIIYCPFWIQAGRDPALFYDSDTGEVDEFKGHGLALRVEYTFEYEEFNRTLAPGQSVHLSFYSLQNFKPRLRHDFSIQRTQYQIRLYHPLKTLAIPSETCNFGRVEFRLIPSFLFTRQIR